MEKEQLDSLATVTVGSEKIPPPHSHYAPSEVYSSSESPPAYSRPVMKSTAVQIAKIIATTLIAISVIIGSFILAAAWLQARASCSPEAINAMQTQINSQQQPSEFIKHLQPEALVQDPIDAKQNIGESSVKTKPIPSDPKEEETQTDNQDDSKADNESGNDNENEDDYSDSGFSPVHIKFPLQLDLDDLANTLMQQSRGLVSCVVERRRSDDFNDGNNQVDNNNNNNNNNDYQRHQRLGGERVVILCESGEPRRQEQQEQDLLTPIIVPLGNIQIPMQPHEQDYHRYQVQNQFPAPDAQNPSFVNARRINQLEQSLGLPEIRNIQQMLGLGSPQIPQQINNNQQMELRPFPIEIRTLPIEMIRGMRPPMNQMQQHQPQPQQQQPQHQPHHPMFPQEPSEQVYSQEQQTQGMMPPPPPPASPVMPEMNREPRIIPQVHIIQQQLEQKPTQPQEARDKPNFPFPGLPIDIIRFIQQVPLKIKSIIQHIDEEMKPEQDIDRTRQEQVQEFKPFPMNARPVQFNGPIRPIELRNLMEHESIEAHRQENLEGQQQSTKLTADSESQEENKDDEDKKKIVVLPERSFIHRIEERLFPRPQFPMPLRSLETFQVPIGVSARVMGNSDEQEDNKEQNQPLQAQVMPQSDEQEDINRPHYVQPRSVR